MSNNKLTDFEEANHEEENIVKLINENGQEVEFDHLMTFMHEGEKYIALLPMDDVDGVDDDAVVILHVVTKGGEDVYESIESEVLLEEVFEDFLEQFDEMLDEED